MRHKLTVVVVMGAALGLGACRKSSQYAEGSGYGVGRARPTWIFGNEPQSKGDHIKLGTRAPTDRGIGLVPAARDTGHGQAKR